ncbi:virulence protein [Klebsiella pneumoniae]|uniref:Virulence protein n=1 Tax=Klebsiella pneumoniae TaxID=573 RepID=A0A378BE71_KLEPN|nr:virulence protein [Klebsiella pneumoniae]
MFVELIYDKRNFAGLPGAREAILNELTNACSAFSRRRKCG